MQAGEGVCVMGDRQPGFWAVIPDTVLSATDIKPNAKLLYAKVTSLQAATGYCYASNKYLANGLGLAPDTVTRLLNELANAGYLRLEIVKDEKNAVVERRIYPTVCLPPIGQTSDTLSDKHPIPSRINIRQINKEESKEEKNPPLPPKGGSASKRAPKAVPEHKPERFEGFWAFYPRGENRKAAAKAWDRLKPDDALIDQMAAALKQQKRSEQWLRGIGIPYASSWINGRRWEDDLEKASCVQDSAPQMFDPHGGLQRC